jgi:hypothetical protein
MTKLMALTGLLAVLLLAVIAPVIALVLAPFMPAIPEEQDEHGRS